MLKNRVCLQRATALEGDVCDSSGWGETQAMVRNPPSHVSRDPFSQPCHHRAHLDSLRYHGSEQQEKTVGHHAERKHHG